MRRRSNSKLGDGMPSLPAIGSIACTLHVSIDALKGSAPGFPAAPLTAARPML